MSGQMNVFVPITKIDAAKRLVYGVATGEQPDRSGEVCDYASTKPLYEKWSSDMAKASEGKSLGNLRAMHGKIAAGKVTSIAFNDDARQIEICAKVVDDQEWKKVEEGVYTGFSQGGAYVKRWADPENAELMRYTAQPSEISLVDLPCLPSATFEVIKADGSTEMRKFHESAAAKEPTNSEIAAKATELAKAAGDETKWPDHLDAAREALTKAAEIKPEATENKGDGVVTSAPVGGAAPNMTDEWEQVWLSKRDGSIHKAKADLRKHHESLDAAEAAKAAAGPADAALSALEAKFGKAAPKAEDKPENVTAATKAELAGILRKFVGEETWDASTALSALQSIFGLLYSEMAEDEKEPEQLAALRAAIESLKAFIVAEIQENNDPNADQALEQAVKLLDLAKSGARNSAADKKHIQAAHDHLAALGAECSGGADKSAQSGGLEKSETLAKVEAENEALKAQFAALTKRVEELAAMPVPPPVLQGTAPVEKSGDVAPDSIEAQFAKMTPEEQSLVLLKIAQQQPRNIMSRG